MAHYQQLATETKRVLDDHGWSLAAANIHTGVNRTVVHNMTKGLRPSYNMLIQWADAIKEERSYWLGLGGYGDLAGALPASQEGSAPGSGEYHPDDVPPELARVWGLQGRVVRTLPPGKARDKYLEGLRANAESMLEMIAERLDKEEKEEAEQKNKT